MEEYYPSEIARLVLGYLKEVECHNAWKTFVQESFDLREYYNLYRQGKNYTTNVNGKTLIDTLGEYCALKSKAVNKLNQNKCPNNAFQNNEVDKTPSEVIEKIKVTDQMVQTSISPCQNPKRKSKCRVTQQDFDNETECINRSVPHENVNVDELSCSNSAPNSVINRNDVIIDNNHSKSVMTIKFKLCNTSVQADLNVNYEDQNNCSISVQTENLRLCPPSLSKSSQETFQSNTNQASYKSSISNINPSDVHNSSSLELVKATNSFEVDKCDGVVKSFSTANNKTLSEICNCGKYIESETVSSDEMSRSLVSNRLKDKTNSIEERSPKRMSKSPVSNYSPQTITDRMDTSENMDITAGDPVSKDRLVEDTAFEKNSCNSDQMTVKISSVSSDRYNTEENMAHSENFTDIQNENIVNVSEPDNHTNANNEATELSKETPDPLHENEIPRHSNLNLESKIDNIEIASDNQEIARSTYCEPQLENSYASSESSSILNEFNSEIENKFLKNWSSYSELYQDSKSECISSKVERHQSILNIPSDITSIDKISDDVTLGVKWQKESEDSNSTKSENKPNNDCFSDLDLEISSISDVTPPSSPEKERKRKISVSLYSDTCSTPLDCSDLEIVAPEINDWLNKPLFSKELTPLNQSTAVTSTIMSSNITPVKKVLNSSPTFYSPSSDSQASCLTTPKPKSVFRSPYPQSVKPKSMECFYRKAFPDKKSGLTICPISFSNSSCTAKAFSFKRQLREDESCSQSTSMSNSKNASKIKDILNEYNKNPDGNDYAEGYNNQNLDSSKTEKDCLVQELPSKFNENERGYLLSGIVGSKRKMSESLYYDTCSTVADCSDLEIVTPEKNDWLNKPLFSKEQSPVISKKKELRKLSSSSDVTPPSLPEKERNVVIEAVHNSPKPFPDKSMCKSSASDVICNSSAMQDIHVENVIENSSIESTVTDTEKQTAENVSNSRITGHKSPLNTETQQSTSAEEISLSELIKRDSKLHLLLGRITTLGLDKVLDRLKD